MTFARFSTGKEVFDDYVKNIAERHGLDPDRLNEAASVVGVPMAMLPNYKPTSETKPLTIGIPRRVEDVTSGNLPERKKDSNGDIRLMALKDGYVMARHVGRMPFVLTLHAWLQLDDVTP